MPRLCLQPISFRQRNSYPDDIVAAQERLAAKRLAEQRNAEAADGSNGSPGADSSAPAVSAVKR
ncbi:hypothetical protein [Burkholderia sola]